MNINYLLKENLDTIIPTTHSLRTPAFFYGSFDDSEDSKKSDSIDSLESLVFLS